MLQPMNFFKKISLMLKGKDIESIRNHTKLLTDIYKESAIKETFNLSLK